MNSQTTLSPIWKTANSFMHSVLNSDLADKDKFELIAGSDLFAVNGTAKEAMGSLVYWGKILATNPLAKAIVGLGESHVYPKRCLIPGTTPPKSLDLYKKAMIAAQVGKAKTVLEVGAGFGQVARLMFLGGLCSKYIIIDLPTSLWAARYFLTNSLPDKRIVQVRDKDELLTLVSKGDYDILLIPHTLAQFCFADVDCFINTSSFGEMRAEACRVYIDLAEKYAKRVVLLNRLMNVYNPRVENFRELDSGWYFMLGTCWNVVEWTLEPSWTRNPYEMAYHHRELLFDAVKSDGEHVPDPRLSIEAQRWWTHRDAGPSMRVKNQLGVDHETACYLFERVRTAKTIHSLKLLDAYLESFGKRYPFEEQAWIKRELSMSKKRNPLNTLTTTLAGWAWKVKTLRNYSKGVY